MKRIDSTFSAWGYSKRPTEIFKYLYYNNRLEQRESNRKQYWLAFKRYGGTALTSIIESG